jgi:hypothetical protein
VRDLTIRTRRKLSEWRSLNPNLLDLKVLAVEPRDYPSASGHQAGNTLTCAVMFKTVEGHPDELAPLRPTTDAFRRTPLSTLPVQGPDFQKIVAAT